MSPTARHPTQPLLLLLLFLSPRAMSDLHTRPESSVLCVQQAPVFFRHFMCARTPIPALINKKARVQLDNLSPRADYLGFVFAVLILVTVVMKTLRVNAPFLIFYYLRCIFLLLYPFRKIMCRWCENCDNRFMEWMIKWKTKCFRNGFENVNTNGLNDKSEA